MRRFMSRFMNLMDPVHEHIMFMDPVQEHICLWLGSMKICSWIGSLIDWAMNIALHPILSQSDLYVK